MFHWRQTVGDNQCLASNVSMIRKKFLKNSGATIRLAITETRSLAHCIEIFIVRSGIRRLGVLLALIFFLLPVAAFAADKSLANREQLLWFPALATPQQEGWNVSISGLITEDEKHPAISWLARRLLGFSHEELGPLERAIFSARTQRFLADDERGKRIEVEFLGKRHKLGRTGRNGHFSGKIVLPQNALRLGAQPFPALVLVNKRVISNEVQICAVPREGISVVSDIDDTIKISDVRNRDELMRNTFLRPFRGVDGMAELYQGWSTHSAAQFHYVSGSPWQLFPALNEFIITNKFPAGSWHLRSVRLLDTSVAELLRTPDVHKRAVIEELFTRLPERKFVLVGDSGERDPEIYGDLARRHPKSVSQIFIRNVTDEVLTNLRMVTAFQGLTEQGCVLFKTAEELPRGLSVKKNQERPGKK